MTKKQDKRLWELHDQIVISFLDAIDYDFEEGAEDFLTPNECEEYLTLRKQWQEE